MNRLTSASSPSSTRAAAHDRDGRTWTYLPYGPIANEEEYRQWFATTCLGDDPLFFVIVDLALGRAVGQASYFNIKPTHGSIEVGHVYFSPLASRTRVATEAMYLMMRHAFEAGYRRYEWKCDSLNAPSRAAAERFGFSYEGIFRQAIVRKGAIATRRGMRRSTAIGRGCRRHSKAGSRRRTSTPAGSSGGRWPVFGEPRRIRAEACGCSATAFERRRSLHATSREAAGDQRGMSRTRVRRFPRPAAGVGVAAMSGAVEKRLAETHTPPIHAVALRPV